MAKVLIVEDEFILSKLYEVILQQNHHTVCAVMPTVTAAREFLAKEQPDLVLLDMRLKNGENGLELLPDLSQKQIPVIVITGNDDAATVEEIKRLGITDILSKPVNQNVLLQKIESILKK